MKLAGEAQSELIKVAALGLGAVLLVWLGYRAIKGTATAITGAIADAVPLVNPIDSRNIVNQGVSAVGGALVTDPSGPGKNADGSWTLGGMLYDLTHKPAFTP